MRLHPAAEIAASSLSPCPLCRTLLPLSITDNSPVKSGLPEGAEEDFSNLQDGYNSPQRNRENGNRHSPVQIIRTMIRDRRRRRRGWRYRTSSIRRTGAGLDVQLTESLREEMQSQIHEQQEIRERMDILERFLEGENVWQEAHRQYSYIAQGIRDLCRRQRILTHCLTRERQHPGTRRRILAAWANALSSEDRDEFFATQNDLLTRMISFRQAVEERGNGSIRSTSFHKTCVLALGIVVARFLCIAWTKLA